MKQELTYLIIGLMFGAILGWFGTSCWYTFHPDSNTIVTYDTKVDTIPYYEPIAVDSVVVRYVTQTLPIVKASESEDDAQSQIVGHAEVTSDSATVAIPIEQKVYESQDYKAWVSGYHASLDSINVYRTTETIRIQEKPKRWHLGISAGYGYGAKGFQPYVGVGVTYSIFSF